MGKIWGILIGLSTIFGLLNGKAAELSSAILKAAELSANTVVSMLGSYSLWLGILGVAQESGLVSSVSRLLMPLLNKLFPKSSEKARAYVTLNFVANLFGMGNAATPFGIKAVNELKTGYKVNDNVSMFMAINTASIQLIPMSVIALRLSAGSADPAGIIPLTLIVSAAGLIFSVLMAFLCRKEGK